MIGQFTKCWIFSYKILYALWGKQFYLLKYLFLLGLCPQCGMSHQSLYLADSPFSLDIDLMLSTQDKGI